MYLVDTNIWLVRILNQEKSAEVAEFLNKVSSERLFTTDFTLHSIGVILNRLNRLEVLQSFVKDLFTDGDVSLIHLHPEDTESILNVIDQFQLDFDDAYQYVAAEKYGLILVSFDRDFDRTARGKRAPSEISAISEESGNSETD